MTCSLAEGQTLQTATTEVEDVTFSLCADCDAPSEIPALFFIALAISLFIGTFRRVRRPHILTLDLT